MEHEITVGIIISFPSVVSNLQVHSENREESVGIANLANVSVLHVNEG